MSMEPPNNIPQDPHAFLGAEECMRVVWPEVRSRPSLSWFLRMRDRRMFEYVRCGRRVFYKASAVQAGLEKNATVKSR